MSICECFHDIVMYMNVFAEMKLNFVEICHVFLSEIVNV